LTATIDRSPFDARYTNDTTRAPTYPMSVEALIADRELRKRHERFATQARLQQGPHPAHDTIATPTTSTVFTAVDFTYDADARNPVALERLTYDRAAR
jgi:hypothetical protein